MPKLPDLPVIAVTPRLRRGNKQVLMTCARAQPGCQHSPGFAQYLPLWSEVKVSGKSSLNDGSFCLSVKIWPTMSVAIPACKFEEGGDVDKNEGQ